MPSSKDTGRVRRKGQITQRPDENDEDYILRRTKNNMAVRKSRDKSKKKTEETLERVNILKVENLQLEEQIKAHKNQLANLKELFLAHAGSGAAESSVEHLEQFLEDTEAEEKASTSQVILGV